MLKQDDIVCQRPLHFTLPSINSEPLQQKKEEKDGK
jgi:hypothetical protein